MYAIHILMSAAKFTKYFGIYEAIFVTMCVSVNKHMDNRIHGNAVVNCL